MPPRTVKQAAEILNVAPATIYELCARRRLRHLRLGNRRGTIRIPEDALNEFITGVTVTEHSPGTPDVAIGYRQQNSRRRGARKA
jgi:excisionase family DNA binding protein